MQQCLKVEQILWEVFPCQYHSDKTWTITIITYGEERINYILFGRQLWCGIQNDKYEWSRTIIMNFQVVMV